MSDLKQAPIDFGERFAALQTNTSAIKAVASAIEGTLGPKGLDTMLVDAYGNVIITNDGVTILNKMDVHHPAAKMVIEVARAQQRELGDGTTTATILSSELLIEAVKQVDKGVSIPKVIAGIKQGITFAIDYLQSHSRKIISLEKQQIFQATFVAGREHQDIAELIVKAARLIGQDKLLDSQFKFADIIVADEGSSNELIEGLIINKKRMNSEMPNSLSNIRLLAIQDAFEPEDIDEEALGTEIGFAKYLEYKERFKQNLTKLVSIGVNVIAVDRGVDPLAEEFCIDHGIMVVQRLNSKDMKRIIEHSGAKPLKRTGLHKDTVELEKYLGFAEKIEEDDRLQKLKITKGSGKPTATILVGASTGEIVEERERIAKDAAASLQATMKGGYVPGGGSIELYIARQLEKQREQVKGLEGFGLQAVANALRKQMAQIVQNAGFNPLEKLEEVKAIQAELDKDTIGINTDTGQWMDMEKEGILDPTLIKIQALKAAGELSEAILRIHTIIKMKREDEKDFD